MEKLVIDLNELTLTEIDEFEEASGFLWIDFVSPGKKPAKCLRALTWIVGKRDNPSLTIEEAGRRRVQDVEIVVGADPTKAREDGPATSDAAGGPSSATSSESDPGSSGA